MPDRQLRPVKYPPSVRDRLWAHWAEAVFVVMGLKQSLLVIFGVFFTVPGPGVVELPEWQAYIIAAFMLFGSILWGYTIIHRFITLSRLLKLQRFSLGFSGLAWIAFALAGWAYQPSIVTAWTTSLVCATAVWGLFRLTWVYEDRARGNTPGRNVRPAGA